ERRVVILVVTRVRGLGVEALPVLLYEDDVLVVLDLEPDGVRAEEVRRGFVERGSAPVALFAHATLVEQVVVLRGLAGGCAERRADLHGRNLAVRGALRPLAVLRLVLLGQTRVEHGAKDG